MLLGPLLALTCEQHEEAPEVAEVPCSTPSEEGAANVIAGGPVPEKPEAWQKQGGCSREDGEERINGACYVRLALEPPCGRLNYEHKGACYRPVGKPPRPDSSMWR
jgi:hypothetical protein